LPYQQQLDLHDYFAPPVPFTEREVLTHRREITKAFPSLPQKAGRAYEALRAAIDGTPNQIVDTFRSETTTVELIAGKRRSLRITGIARPKVDHYRLARALLNLERHDVDSKIYAEAKKVRDRRSH
jgi:hemoglobin-like flavoprotein